MNDHRYDDMIDLPRHVSKTHPPMSMLERAAQFSPFAALTGYEDAIAETGRVTQTQPELTEEEQAVLNRQLDRLRREPRRLVKVTFFQPDERKEGGAIRTVTGRVKKVDEAQGILSLADGTAIPFPQIVQIKEEHQGE